MVIHDDEYYGLIFGVVLGYFGALIWVVVGIYWVVLCGSGYIMGDRVYIWGGGR